MDIEINNHKACFRQLILLYAQLNFLVIGLEWIVPHYIIYIAIGIRNISVSNCVWLLYCLYVKILQLDNWFNMTFQSMQLSQPALRNVQIIVIKMIIYGRIYPKWYTEIRKFLTEFLACLWEVPGYFCTTPCLFSYPIKFIDTTAIPIFSLGWMQPMEGPLCLCPLKLPIFFPKILLPRECNLYKKKQEPTNTKWQTSGRSCI